MHSGYKGYLERGAARTSCDKGGVLTSRQHREEMNAKKRSDPLRRQLSVRTQMAQGLLRHDAGERFHIESAGTKPVTVRPEATAVMWELGMDISGFRSKHVDEFKGQHFDYCITVCDSARESC